MPKQTMPRMRAEIAELRPYVPGRSLESIERELGLTGVMKMNQNENALGPSPKALAAIRDQEHLLNLYPEGPAPELRRKLSERWQLPEEWFLVGDGSDEVFRLLAECYVNVGDAVIVPVPSFGGYPLVSQLMGAKIVEAPLLEWAPDVESMAGSAPELRAAIIFLCRPNSPTGAVFSRDALQAGIEKVSPDTLIVVDEAYAEFAEQQLDVPRLLEDYPNLIVTRTFSKVYGLAGVRLGYGIMRPELMEPLLRARDPFSVNSLAIAAGVAALEDDEHVARTLEMVREGKRFLYALFERLDVEFVPTEANFILFHTSRPARDVYEDLLQRGVLVRPCDSFGLPHSLRVTIGTHEQNEAFAAALEDIRR